jgi:SAM-dependent methyltransferase
MHKNAERACPICQTAVVDVLHSERFVLPEGHPLPDRYDVVCCDGCGFVYADSPATQADYDRYYALFSKYEDNQTTTGAGETPTDARRLAQTADAIAEALPDRSAAILDVGCANGGLLNALKRRDYTCLHGVDPSPACAANTTQQYGIPASVGSLYQLGDGLGRFDLVLLSHVLEHLRDLAPAIAAVASRVCDGGLLYVEVPDAARYADFLVAPFQDFNTEHINHFSPRVLDNLLARFGLSPLTLGRKTFESAPGALYPAVYGFWRNDSGRPALYRKEIHLRERIEAYIARSAALMAAFNARLETSLAEGADCLVWGTGQLTMKLLAGTCLARRHIVAFVDGNPINQGKVLCGAPVLAPAAIRGLPCPIVIASTIHQAAIACRAAALGLSNRLIVLGEETQAAA